MGSTPAQVQMRFISAQICFRESVLPLLVTNKAVMEALDGLPPVKVHCSLLAEEAVHAALWDYAEKNGITIEGLKKPKNDIHEDDPE